VDDKVGKPRMGKPGHQPVYRWRVRPIGDRKKPELLWVWPGR